jgi:hypothetical protein
MGYRGKGNNPLAYMGIDMNLPSVTEKSTDPTTANKNFDPGDIWVNKSAKKGFMFASGVGSVGTWLDLSGGSASIDNDFISGILAVEDYATAVATEGNRYIANATAGTWTQHYIYTYENGSWTELVPTDGALGFNEDTAAFVYWDGSAWSALTSGVTTLAGLNDTTIAAPGAGAMLFYDGVNSWDNKAVSGDCTAASTGAITVVSSTGMVLTTSVSGTAVLDQDDMVGDSATQIATQQSIKAYVDSGTVTMTNKTLTAPDINGGTVDSLTGFSIRSSGAAFDLEFDTAEVLTGNHIISWNVGDTDRAITLGGDVALAGALTTLGDFIQTGAHNFGFTTTGATAITFPTSGTLITLAGTETLTNKILSDSTCVFGDNGDVTKTFGVELSGATGATQTTFVFAQTVARSITFQDATHTVVGKDTTDVLTNKTIDADGTGNVISNINMAEMDADTIPAADGNNVTIVDGMIIARVNNNATNFNIFNANAPYAFVVTDAWSVNTSADGGTWKLNNGAAGAGTDITDVVTVAASDKDIDRATTIDDAAWAIAASGSLSVVLDGAGILDCLVFIKIARLA